jgi:hypothetical protein
LVKKGSYWLTEVPKRHTEGKYPENALKIFGNKISHKLGEDFLCWKQSRDHTV